MASNSNQRDTADCIKNWENDLRKASNALTKKQAELNRAEASYDNAQKWATKLDDLCKGLIKTDELSKDVLEEIRQVISILIKVCENTACVKEVIEILYCIIKDFFECTDALKQKLADIKREIECLNDPGLNTSTSIILKCIEDLCLKIDDALKTQQDLIKQVIEVVRCICQLNESLCGIDCSLRSQINDLETLFSQGPEENGGNCETDSCDEKLQPKPSMPLDCDPFYTDSKETAEKANSELDAAKERRSELRKERDGLLSLRNSLIDAIEAAKAAKDCK